MAMSRYFLLFYLTWSIHLRNQQLFSLELEFVRLQSKMWLFNILLNFMWVMQKINYIQLYYISTIAVFFFHWAISEGSINHQLNSAALPPTSLSQNPIKVNFEIWPHDWMSMGKPVIYKAISSLLYFWKMCRNIFLRDFSLQVPKKAWVISGRQSDGQICMNIYIANNRANASKYFLRIFAQVKQWMRFGCLSFFYLLALNIPADEFTGRSVEECLRIMTLLTNWV